MIPDVLSPVDFTCYPPLTSFCVSRDLFNDTFINEREKMWEGGRERENVCAYTYTSLCLVLIILYLFVTSFSSSFFLSFSHSSSLPPLQSPLYFSLSIPHSPNFNPFLFSLCVSERTYISFSQFSDRKLAFIKKEKNIKRKSKNNERRRRNRSSKNKQ